MRRRFATPLPYVLPAVISHRLSLRHCCCDTAFRHLSQGDGCADRGGRVCRAEDVADEEEPEAETENEAGSRPGTRGSEVFLAVGETVILLHPPLPSVGVSIWMERGCQRNNSLADGAGVVESWLPAVDARLGGHEEGRQEDEDEEEEEEGRGGCR